MRALADTVVDTVGNLPNIVLAAEGGYLRAVNTPTGVPLWSSQPTLTGSYLDIDPLYLPQATCC